MIEKQDIVLKIEYELQSVTNALQHLKWKTAINCDYEALKHNITWSFIPLEDQMIKPVFITKYNADYI